MANIMLTYRCNLKCPYCFANEFVNHSKYDITMDNFHAALKFIKTSAERHVGLIGGEPTIHGHFEEILQILADDEEIDAVTIYTNGIQMASCLKFLENKKFNMLVNCNSPLDIGEKTFSEICRNLEGVFQITDVWKRVNLGINLYKDELDFSYIIELAKTYDLHRIRMSVTVPNIDEDKKADSLEYLRGRKDYILDFVLKCAENDIVPYFDCNVIPRCVWSDEQIRILEDIIEKFRLKRTNLLGRNGFCSPVVDILPDLNAVRCFGTSDFTKVSIKDFRCFDDLRKYYINMVDRHAPSCMHDDRCKSCYERKVLQCTAGCLAFMRDDLTSRISDSDKI